jgi:hypothetical protein
MKEKRLLIENKFCGLDKLNFSVNRHFKKLVMRIKVKVIPVQSVEALRVARV